jgi:hypothetical protein
MQQTRGNAKYITDTNKKVHIPRDKINFLVLT